MLYVALEEIKKNYKIISIIYALINAKNSLIVVNTTVQIIAIQVIANHVMS